MKFKLDENFPGRAAPLLKNRGHDCHTVHDEGLSGALDQRVIDVCLQEGRILITHDLDFSNIIHYPPGNYAGIIIFRLSSSDSSTVLDRLGQIEAMLSGMELAGHLLIVDESRIRYR